MHQSQINELITKEQAIAVADKYLDADGCNGSDVAMDIVGDLIAIPSAEPPEHTFEIQDILDYLDTVLHPIVSPEHWNVYSELHDMISTLQSAQQERTTGRWERKMEVEHETD